MERIRTDQVTSHVGERVKLAGWMHNWRDMGKFGFLVLRDGAGTFQAVFDKPAEMEKLQGLQYESVLELEGVVAEEPRAPAGAELRDCEVRVISPVLEPLPFEINKKELKPGLDIFLNHAPLGLRHLEKRALFRISAGSATESGANVFQIDYCGRPAYVAQSPQFYKQIMVGVFERVFEIGPVFRAEKHSTSRHTNEYVSLDFEMGFIKDHTDVMAMLTEVMRHMFDRLTNERARELERLKMHVPTVGDSIPSFRLLGAQQLIFERYGEDCRGEPDLAPQHEAWLCEYAEQELGSELLFITHYPTSKRPFYTMPDEEDPSLSKGFDLLFRGCEIVTGGQRIHSFQQLHDNAIKWGINPEDIDGYLQAFRYGMPPHGGCAIGLERLVMQLAGLGNLRESTLFPRDLDRVSP
ncbi:MAG: hypothetical protein AMJ93_16035 [Anaerolineae bacterium SM23_84]|nr:MAG: hypothetical protein AMJ93_16035 [Anaerolineae bacterium SM23_84]